MVQHRFCSRFFWKVSMHAIINTSNNVKFHRITDISNLIFVTIYGAFVTETIK